MTSSDGDTASGNIDHSKIKIGGYLPNNSYKFIGYMDGEAFHSISLTIEGEKDKYYSTND